ncbi:MAG: ABC transporter substrate-binding protein, partial [Saprospiraceae bacterium]
MNVNKLLLLVLVLSTCCWSCDSEPQLGSPKVFHYNQPNAITSLDPAFARSQNNIWAIDHLYNGLLQLDESLNIKPCIAKDWRISDDGLTYTFQLRNDVYFHNDPAFPDGKGRRVVAADFIKSFERILDPEVGSPGAWIFRDRLDTLEAFAAPNEETFVLKLSGPFRPMLGILTMQYCAVVPPEIVAHYGRDFREHPVGTGPYQFKRWMENQALFLKRNDNYFEKDEDGKLPYQEGIRISFINDRKTAYLELMSGRIDYMSGLDASFVNELLTKEGELQYNLRDQLQFLKSPYLNMEYLGINMASDDPDNPLLIKKVR